MNGRLASFRGPSTPNSSPVQRRKTSTPSSPARLIESTYHRKLRIYLLEIKTATVTWDDLVLIDGLRAVKSLVDARTELDNELALIPDRRPRTRIVAPKLALMERRIAELDSILVKMQKQFRKMNTTIDAMETLLTDAYKTKGWQFAQQEPLWTTWSLDHFVTSIPDILPAYHRELHTHISLVNTLRHHSVSFEESRQAVAAWSEQPWIEDRGWDSWEDICSAEVDRWDV